MSPPDQSSGIPKWVILLGCGGLGCLSVVIVLVIAGAVFFLRNQPAGPVSPSPQHNTTEPTVVGPKAGPDSTLSTSAPPSVDYSSLSHSQLLDVEKGLMQQAAGEPDNDAVITRLSLARKRLAVSFLEQKDLENAIQYLSNGLVMGGGKADEWAMLGDWFLLTHEPAARHLAYDAYERALDLDPALRDVRKRLTGLYLDAGRFQDAVDVLKRSVRQHQEAFDWDDASMLAALYALVDVEAGIRFFKSMAEETADSRFITLVSVLMNANGNVKDATELLNHIAETEPPDTLVCSFAQYLAGLYTKEDAQRLHFPEGTVHYFAPVTKAEAEALGRNFLNGTSAKGIYVQLLRPAKDYVFRFVVTDTAASDKPYLEKVEQYRMELSRNVFNEAPVTIHLCNKDLETLVVIGGKTHVARTLRTLK